MPSGSSADNAGRDDVFTSSHTSAENQGSHPNLFNAPRQRNDSNEYIDINVSPTSSDPEENPPNPQQQVKCS